jgi:hypothetical protein
LVICFLLPEEILDFEIVAPRDNLDDVPFPMKLRHLFTSCLLLASVALAQNPFPGLQKVLTEAEWKRAGLDRLTPDQIGVIDAALIRHSAAEAKGLIAAVTTGTPPEPPAGASPAEAAAARSRFWDKFGLGKLAGGDWRTQPPMKAKVTSWQGANRFSLDTGQVWEGTEAIPYEILGKEITISARPLGAFALKLNDDTVEVRVRRVK